MFLRPVFLALSLLCAVALGAAPPRPAAEKEPAAPSATSAKQPARPAEPAPLQHEDDFDTTAAGQHPRLARVSEGAGSVRVSTEAPRSGKHCLKITDGPDVKPPQHPQFHYEPQHRAGVTRVAFSVRVAPNVSVVHEWRTKAEPHRTGPSVRIEDGWITSSGQQLAPIDDGEWVRVELSMNLGEAADGTFDVVIRRAGEPPERYVQLPCADSEVKEIGWIGFITPRSAASAWWLDDLSIANHSDSATAGESAPASEQ